jgi:hypothetical protein
MHFALDESVSWKMQASSSTGAEGSIKSAFSLIAQGCA